MCRVGEPRRCGWSGGGGVYIAGGRRRDAQCLTVSMAALHSCVLLLTLVTVVALSLDLASAKRTYSPLPPSHFQPPVFDVNRSPTLLTEIKSFWNISSWKSILILYYRPYYIFLNFYYVSFSIKLLKLHRLKRTYHILWTLQFINIEYVSFNLKLLKVLRLIKHTPLYYGTYNF